MSRFKLLGVNDDHDTCCCCGKTGLKKVVFIQDNETGSVQWFGVNCAENPAKAFGINASAIRSQVNAFVQTQSRIKNAKAYATKWLGKTVSHNAEVIRKGLFNSSSKQFAIVEVISEFGIKFEDGEQIEIIPD